MKRIFLQITLTLLMALLLGTGVAVATGIEPVYDEVTLQHQISVGVNETNSVKSLAAMTPTTIITVTTASDTSGDSLVTSCYYDFAASPCSFRRAIVEASKRPTGDRPILIKFDIPFTDNYSLEVSGTWTLVLDAVLPPLDRIALADMDDGLVTIDGAELVNGGGRTDGPPIIIDNGDTSLEIESGQNTIRNISYKGGGAIFLKQDAQGRGGNNVAENLWFGLSDNGQDIVFRTPGQENRMAVGAGVNAASDGNTIRNNIIVAAFSRAIDIQGDNNIVTDNWVGMRSDGAVPEVSDALKCTFNYFASGWYGGWGIQANGTGNQIISNTLAGLNNVRSQNDTPPIAMDVFGTNNLVQNNTIGRDANGYDAGVCGQGIQLDGSGQQILDNTIVDPKSGFINGNSNDPTVGAIFANGDPSTSFDANTIRRNVVITSPGEVIEFGPAIPSDDPLKTFNPAKITSISGTTVVGTNGDGSPCGNCIIDLYLDNTDSVSEALEVLAAVTATASGDFTATLSAPLPENHGIRTSSTTQGPLVIGFYDAGVTTRLSELYMPAGSVIALSSLSIQGPSAGNINTSYVFTVTVAPANATKPITYFVEATGYTPGTPSITSTGFTLPLQWSTAGAKLITVTATNNAGTVVSNTHTIQISGGSQVAPTSLTISGPTTGALNQPLDFSFTVEPPDVTTPISYVVSATDLGTFPQQQTNNRTVNLPSLNWSNAGTKTIQITATNATSVVVSNTHTVVISDTSSQSETTTIGPAGGSHTFSDGTSIDVPPGVVSATTTFTYTAVNTTSNPISGSLSFAGRSFNLSASSQISGRITVTLQYSDQDLVDAGITTETTLALYFWNEGAGSWDDVADGCGTYNRDFAANILAAPICHLSEFALLGEAQQGKSTIYLPLVLK